jgi:hypothetical protein
MPEDNLNNCDPPIIIPPNTVDPGRPGGGGGGSGGAGGGSGGGGSGGAGGGRGGAGGGARGGVIPPTRPRNNNNNDGTSGGSGGGGGGSGGGGGAADSSNPTGADLNCKPFSGPQMNTNKGKGWGETPTQYGKVKGKKIKGKKNDCGCEGSDGEGDNDEDRFKDVTIYPYNKVTETESGHVVEFDDTPGSERISTNHRSGTFEEYHPNGDKVVKVVRDNYVSVLRDGHVHIDGYCNVTVDKALKIMVNKDESESSENSAVNFDIHIGKNANVNIYIEKGNLNVLVDEGDSNIQLKKGDVNIRQDCGHYNHFVNGDYNIECTGHMHMVVGEDHVTEIGGNRDTRIDGKFDNLEMTKEGSKQETKIYDRGLFVRGNTQEFYHYKVERDYGYGAEGGSSTIPVIEIYRQGAERTYSKDTKEKYTNLSKNIASDLSIRASRSVIRTDKDNFLMSENGFAGMQAYGGINIDAGVYENRRNKDATLKIFSENLSFIGGKKSTNIFSRDEVRLSALNRIKFFAGSQILRNKEIEQSGTLFVANEEPLSTSVNTPIDPTQPVKFIYCPPANWVPTKQKEKCKKI